MDDSRRDDGEPEQPRPEPRPVHSAAVAPAHRRAPPSPQGFGAEPVDAASASSDAAPGIVAPQHQVEPHRVLADRGAHTPPQDAPQLLELRRHPPASGLAKRHIPSLSGPRRVSEIPRLGRGG